MSPKENNPTTDTDRTPFSVWLAEHRRGDLDSELGARLMEVLQAVRIHGKPGALTLKINIDPKGRTVVVTDNVVTKTPEAEREGAIYFATHDGRLSRDDPGQTKFNYDHQEDQP